jgi:hypothetical protein
VDAVRSRRHSAADFDCADGIKAMRPYTPFISSDLHAWNYVTLAQRANGEFWRQWIVQANGMVVLLTGLGRAVFANHDGMLLKCACLLFAIGLLVSWR